MINPSDCYATPPEIFAALDAEFGFGFDVCAEDETAKCPEYWTIEDDALSQDWSEIKPLLGGWLWCNPPYSKIGPWVEKARQAQSAGVGTVMLVMADTSVGWFNNALQSVSEIRFIVNGRLSFLNDGQPKNGNNKGSMLLVFNPHSLGARHVSFVPRDLLISRGCSYLAEVA